jgi:lipopolysaccharide export system protein LptC
LAHAYSANDAGSVKLSRRSRGNSEQAYRAAMRHSRLVRWLRIGVLASIAGLLFAVVAANFMPDVGEFQLPGELGKLVIKGTKITMQQPRLSGFTSDSRPYTFTADAAAQDVSNPDFLELRGPKAKVDMADGSTVNMSATSGTYDLKSEMLTLTDNVHVVSSTGYESRLSEAAIDVRKGNVVSNKPVWVKLLNGFLNGDSMEITENGNVLRFSGGVKMTLNPDSDTTPGANQP